MDDLTKICYKLEQCGRREKCYCNEIICVEKVLDEYIGRENSKLLKLKVELKNSYEIEKAVSPNWSLTLSAIALWLTVSSNIYGSDSIQYNFMVLVCLGILLCMKIGTITVPKDMKLRKKWRNHIEIVLEEMEKSK